MRAKGAATALTIALLIAAPAAVPQTLPEPCRADADRLCAEETSPKDLVRCLRENRGDLSDGCRASFLESPRREEVVRRFVEACEADVAAHCADVPKGGLRVIGCLMKHRDEVSDACREALPPER